MEDLKSGRGIQVVTPGPEHTFCLDENALEELLLREDLRDRAAVVISVAGAFRKGKSFLLDFFLRYLYHKVRLLVPRRRNMYAHDNNVIIKG